MHSQNGSATGLGDSSALHRKEYATAQITMFAEIQDGLRS
jgi:hypothetical protein